MRKLALALGIFLTSAGALNGNEALSMRVTPTVVLAPGAVTVSVTVERDADNRALQIVAESPDYYRSSQIPLDGQNAPRVNIFELKSLPTGLYEVTGVLVRTQGRRTVVQRLAQVQPSPGNR